MVSGALVAPAALAALALGMMDGSRSLLLVAVLGLVSCCCRQLYTSMYAVAVRCTPSLGSQMDMPELLVVFAGSSLTSKLLIGSKITAGQPFLTISASRTALTDCDTAITMLAKSDSSRLIRWAASLQHGLVRYLGVGRL